MVLRRSLNMPSSRGRVNEKPDPVRRRHAEEQGTKRGPDNRDHEGDAADLARMRPPEVVRVDHRLNRLEAATGLT